MTNYNNLKLLISKNPHLNYVDKQVVNHNIVTILNCTIEETKHYKLLKGGYTNPVFTFDYNGDTYVYRYPGLGSEDFINRKSEYIAHNIAKDLGLDDSLIWIDEDGHKISKFINDYRYFDYQNKQDVLNIIDMMKIFHNSDQTTGIKYDIMTEIDNFYNRNFKYNKSIYSEIEDLRETVTSIYNTLDYEKSDLSICHNDVYTTNILITEEKTYLIDWEFAKDTHPALDLATFFLCSPYTIEEIIKILKLYLNDSYSKDEELLFVKYFIVGGFYWLLWALHVEANGGDTEGFVQTYYNHLNSFIQYLD